MWSGGRRRREGTPRPWPSLGSPWDSEAGHDESPDDHRGDRTGPALGQLRPASVAQEAVPRGMLPTVFSHGPTRAWAVFPQVCEAPRPQDSMTQTVFIDLIMQHKGPRLSADVRLGLWVPPLPEGPLALIYIRFPFFSTLLVEAETCA